MGLTLKVETEVRTGVRFTCPRHPSEVVTWSLVTTTRTTGLGTSDEGTHGACGDTPTPVGASLIRGQSSSRSHRRRDPQIPRGVTTRVFWERVTPEVKVARPFKSVSSEYMTVKVTSFEGTQRTRSVEDGYPYRRCT